MISCYLICHAYSPLVEDYFSQDGLSNMPIEDLQKVQPISFESPSELKWGMVYAPQ